MTRLICVLAIVVCGALVPRAARGGIVNVQSALADEAPEGASGSITGSVDWRSGNVDVLILGGTLLGRYRRGDNLAIAIVRGNFGRSGEDDAEFMKNSFEHLRFRRTLTGRLLAELFVQHEFDEFRRLELRALVGVGPKIDLIQRKGASVGVGVAYMLEYEQLRDDGAADAGEDDLAHRASSYAVGRIALDDRVELVEVFYVQPRLTDAGDLRLLNDSALTVKLTDRVAMTTLFSLSYDTEPPDTVEELDVAFKTSLTIGF